MSSASTKRRSSGLGWWSATLISLALSFLAISMAFVLRPRHDVVPVEALVLEIAPPFVVDPTTSTGFYCHLTGRGVGAELEWVSSCTRHEQACLDIVNATESNASACFFSPLAWCVDSCHITEHDCHERLVASNDGCSLSR